MKKHFLKFPQIFLATLILLLIASIGLPCAAAQAAADDPACWGVFVGVGTYEDFGAWETIYDEDAEELYNEISPTWGASHTQLVKNENATKAGVLASINWLATNAGPNDTALFFISALGYFPASIKAYDSGTTATNIFPSELANAIDQIHAGKIVVILQVYSSGGFIADLEGSNRVIITSSDDGEPAWLDNTLGHSYFGKYVIDAFKNFNDADENHDFELTAEEVYAYAAPLTTADKPDQHPQISDQYSGGLPILAKFACATIPPTSGSTLITLDGVDYTSSIAPRLWVPGIPHTLEVPEVINVDSGTRFAFTGWNDGISSASRVVTHGALQANYQKEYLLTINSSYGNPTGAGWYAMGATASFSVTDYVETLNIKRTFNGWSGAFSGATASGTLLMDSPKTITADWSSQYLLTINSEYGAPTGAGWYNENQSANVSVDSSTGSIIKQVFDGWTGDITTTNPATSIVMNGPKVITAAWHTDLMMLYIIIIVVVVVVAGVITFVVLRRRGGTPGAAATAGTPPASTPMSAPPPVEPPPPGGMPSPPPPPPPPTR